MPCRRDRLSRRPGHRAGQPRLRCDQDRPTRRRSNGAYPAAQISYLEAPGVRPLREEVVGHRLLELAEGDRREADALDLRSDPAGDRIRPLAELADHASERSIPDSSSYRGSPRTCSCQIWMHLIALL